MEEQHPTVPTPAPKLVRVEIVLKSGATVKATVEEFRVLRNPIGPPNYEWRYAPGYPKLMFLAADEVVSVTTEDLPRNL